MNATSALSSLAADQPLIDPSQDRLHRRPFAKDLARSIFSIEPKKGFVYALTGPWGSGKTTVLKFTEKFLEDLSTQYPDRLVIVHFNAWWVSESDRLLHDFFKQFRLAMESPLGRKYKSFAKSITDYSAALEPIPYIGQGAAVVHRFDKVRRAREGDLNELRKKIDGRLETFSGRILVIIDDIDRLRPDETRLMFRLVKAIADFPRTIYLLAYDEPVVAKAVGDNDSKVGREYLDKIVQLPLTLPTPDQATLKEWFREGMEHVLKETPGRLRSSSETHALLLSLVERFLTTPRHVVRFLNLLRATYPMVRGEVNPVHFVFIQALRQFTPTLHTFVAYSGHRIRGLARNNDEAKKLEQAIGEALDTDLGVHRAIDTQTIRELLERLFNPEESLYPSMMEDNCSIGHALYFPRYFHLGVLPGTLSESEREEVMSLMPDVTAFGEKLKELTLPVRLDGGSRLGDLLSHLKWDTRVHHPHNNIQSVLCAFYEVGDELLTEGGMATLRDSERFGFTKELLTVTRAIVCREMAPDQRRRLLIRIFGEARALFTVACHLYEFEKEPFQTATLGAERADALKEVVVERFRKAACNPSLQSVPFLEFVLSRYAEWADEEEVEEYVSKLVQTDQGLCDCFAGLVYEGAIDRSHIEKFLLGNGDFVVRSRRILDGEAAWLTPRHRVGLEAYLKQMERPSA